MEPEGRRALACALCATECIYNPDFAGPLPAEVNLGTMNDDKWRRLDELRAKAGARLGKAVKPFSRATVARPAKSAVPAPDDMDYDTELYDTQGNFAYPLVEDDLCQGCDGCCELDDGCNGEDCTQAKIRGFSSQLQDLLTEAAGDGVISTNTTETPPAVPTPSQAAGAQAQVVSDLSSALEECTWPDVSWPRSAQPTRLSG